MVDMFHVKRIVAILASIALLLTASGCSNRVKERLGLIERGPDEFTVITHPELEIPQDFSILPAPQSGIKKTHSNSHMSKYHTEVDDIDAAILEFDAKSYEESSIHDSNDAKFMEELR